MRWQNVVDSSALLGANGQALTIFWYRKYSSLRSGTRWPSTSVLNFLLILLHCPSRFFHSLGISDSTLRRARTSSPRLVSCVDVVESAYGHRACRSRIRSWNDGTG